MTAPSRAVWWTRSQAVAWVLFRTNEAVDGVGAWDGAKVRNLGALIAAERSLKQPHGRGGDRFQLDEPDEAEGSVARAVSAGLVANRGDSVYANDVRAWWPAVAGPGRPKASHFDRARIEKLASYMKANPKPPGDREAMRTDPAGVAARIGVRVGNKDEFARLVTAALKAAAHSTALNFRMGFIDDVERDRQSQNLATWAKVGRPRRAI